MAFFKIEAANQLAPVTPTTFHLLDIKERRDLQAMLRNHVAAIDANLLVVAEEFSNWQDSLRRVDLLALDKNANLVVIELKRVEEGGHMELQALRYAAMLSTVDFTQLVDAYTKLLEQTGQDSAKAEQNLLDFLDVSSAEDVTISSTPRVILMAPSFSREITTTVLWLNERGLDIRCLAVVPYELDGQRYLEVEQLIPLPAAADYVVRRRAKAAQVEQQVIAKKDRTSWTTLLDDGTLQVGDRLELLKLPSGLLMHVPPDARLAELVAEPKGQVRWLEDGNVYSISRLCGVICARFAPGAIRDKYPFDGPAYWAREGEKQTLADIARTLPIRE